MKENINERAMLYFKELLSVELKVPVHKIEEDVPMEEYGIDSVMVMQMTDKLEETFGSLPKTLFFEYQTIGELTEYFMSEYQQKLNDILGIQKEGSPTELSVSKESTTLYFKELLSEELKVPKHKIENDVPMEEYGIDSVMIMQMTDKLEEAFGVLPKTLFFEYRTIEEITEYFMEEHHQKLKEIIGSASTNGNQEPDINTDRDPNLSISLNKGLGKGLDQIINQGRIQDRSDERNHDIDKDFNKNFNNDFYKDSKRNINSNRNINLDNVFEKEEKYIPFITSGLEKRNQKKRFVSFKQGEKEDKEEKNISSDIAIIGLGGKYPQSEDLNEYWENLKSGRNCITEIPEDRWDYTAYYDQDKQKEGKINSKWGGFLDGVYQFDPLFFNISPHEAEIIDPQERLFLTCVHETLEDAGYTKEACSRYKENGMEGNIGVFVGALFEEYQFYGAQEQAQGNMIALNGSLSSIANRVSYYFNFHGPSMAVDTLCSSSLTAIHLACQSLQKGDCEMAVAGGVNVTLHPNKYVLLGQNNFLSSKGLCESFGEGGDGYVPGEGVGAILLKPVDKAVAEGDHIYGVIKSTAINHGGKTNGYTVPNPNAQAEVIRRAYKKADINPRAMGYIEAHGTGTALGDPIEISGLNKVFSEYTEDKQFCRIGSVKSNIGHCESAAGIAGITKILLQMKYGYLVPSLHSKTLNPGIDFNTSAFKVQQNLEPWKRCTLELNGETKEYPLMAGISSFGAGGSNAHIVIEEYLKPTLPVNTEKLSQQIYVFSARDEKRLKQYAVKHQSFITAYSDKDESDTGSLFQDIAYTLQVGREAMQERIAVVASDLKEVKKKLQDYINGEEYIPNLYQGNTKLLTIKDVFEGAASEEFVKALIKSREFDKLAELWVSGVAIDWRWLYADDSLPQLISIPTYPFAKGEYCLAKPVIVHEKNHNRKESGGSVTEADNFFYIPKWERMKASELKNDKVSKSQKVLFILNEASGAISNLTEKLYKDQEVIKAKLDTCPEKISSHEYRVDSASLASFERLLTEVKDIDTFIYFGGITAGEFDSNDLEYLDLVQEQSVMSLYRLIKAMINCGYESRNITFKLVTNNVHKILPEEIGLPYAAGAFGLVKSAEKEFPNWQVSGFDIDFSGEDILSPEKEAALHSIVYDNLSVSKSEMVIRDKVRYIRKIYPVNLSQQKAAGLKEGGVYLIIGGTGGIGLELSLHIAKKYHGKLILTGRRETNQEIEGKLKQIEALGGKALYVRGDITDPKSMTEVIRTAKDKFGKINGVIHSALVLQDQSLRNMEEETLKQVLAPKVKGSVVLHNVVKEEELDFLMYFSSGQTFIGNQGQSNYAAACAFTDSFALYENEVLGYPVKLINWGYWGEVGIVAGEEYNRRLSANGIYPIQTQEGIDGIEKILSSGAVQTLAMKAS
ncbi:MAG: pksL 6, partial [Anaerocolumna sp.]|nr:pksL 6 [Anaerocolumna sp.]